MTQPAPGYRSREHWTVIRLLAVVATIACLVCGVVIAFTTPTGDSLKNWISAGIISAGVALGCVIIV